MLKMKAGKCKFSPEIVLQAKCRQTNAHTHTFSRENKYRNIAIAIFCCHCCVVYVVVAAVVIIVAAVVVFVVNIRSHQNVTN